MFARPFRARPGSSGCSCEAPRTRPSRHSAAIDIAVDRGEIVGLVGPNGAGKTTLIRTIATVLDPTEGSVTVDGFDTQTDPIEVRRRLGLVLTDDRALYWRLTGRQNLEFFARMSGLDRRTTSERIDELLVRFGLANRDKMVYAYSSGMRARLSIARALVHEPPMLVLDEPTRSLDPVSTREVGQLMRSLADDGRAILLSSHRVDEIEQLCDRIVVLVGRDRDLRRNRQRAVGGRAVRRGLARAAALARRRTRR